MLVACMNDGGKGRSIAPHCRCQFLPNSLASEKNFRRSHYETELGFKTRQGTHEVHQRVWVRFSRRMAVY